MKAPLLFLFSAFSAAMTNRQSLPPPGSRSPQALTGGSAGAWALDVVAFPGRIGCDRNVRPEEPRRRQAKLLLWITFILQARRFCGNMILLTHPFERGETRKTCG